ncbi:MAG: hypothetical protein GEU73_12045 [Chloroflexi bacterium]|nr:hypothetical protein [Chloroflexota bacterium]
MRSSASRPRARRTKSRPFRYYLYGVVEPGTEAHRLLVERRVEGIEPSEPLFPIEATGLVAGVSRVPASQFDEEPLNELAGDLSRLSPLVVRHEQAVRALLRPDASLVPMAFGAVYSDAERIAQFLHEGADRLQRLLDKVRGREEWGLKVIADPQRLQQSTEISSGAVRALERDAADARPGRAYLLARQRDRLLATEARRRAIQGLDEILARLSTLSAAIHRDALPAEQPGGTQLALKASFLVDSHRVNSFQATAEELDREYRPVGLAVELTGPWAAYSFVSTLSE